MGDHQRDASMPSDCEKRLRCCPERLRAGHISPIEAFKPKVKRYEVHDLLCPGFTLRVLPTGRKVFSVKYRYGLTQRRLPLGVHPRISLADARNKALGSKPNQTIEVQRLF